MRKVFIFCTKGCKLGMKALILMGSFRKNGNTATFAEPFISKLRASGVDIEVISLYDKDIAPCISCRVCQNVLDEYGCSQKDDMHEVAEEILKADCIILATPIYIWYCTAPMKAMLDRLYGLIKYYGDTPGPSLLEGKKCGIIATCGYDIEYGVGPFEDGIKRFCEHFHLEYIGKIAGHGAVNDKIMKLKLESEDFKKIALDFAEKVIKDCSK